MSTEPLRAEIARVMVDHPDLSAYGWRFRNRHGWNDGGQFDLHREHMRAPDFERQVAACLDWLRDHAIPKQAGSYGLKHRIEADAGKYIANGAAIVAALLHGYEVERDHNSPNCAFRKRSKP